VTAARRFRGRPESVTAARRFVRDVLRDQSHEVVDAAELMACELATNCVRHAHSDFELAIHSEGQIRVEVRDTNSGQPVLRYPAPEDPSGRGLRIVEAMSDTWGIIPSRNGKTVWFAIQPGASRGAPSSAASGRRGAGGRDLRDQPASGQAHPRSPDAADKTRHGRSCHDDGTRARRRAGPKSLTRHSAARRWCRPMGSPPCASTP
jgi:anti-sigma regulatory factor (Ser/Thr protein kinase)